MTPADSNRRRFGNPPFIVGLAATAILAVAGVAAPAAVLHGWLIAFATFGGVALGCVAWLAIHALTGGRWGVAGRPALVGGANALPVIILLLVPMILGARWLYPWAADPAAAGPGVAHLYLNAGGLALRSVVLLGGMAWVAWRTRKGPLSPLVAALGLLLYGVLMNLSAFDWLLSLDPRYTSSAFGMQIIVAQLLSALCVVVLTASAREDDPVWGDYGSLMLATLLGEGYLILMTFVVHWYGNLPDQAAWYLGRSHGFWRWFEMVAVLVGFIGPAGALLLSRVRHSLRALRMVAAAILVGVVAEYVWLVAPSLGPAAGWAIGASLLALLACGGLVRGVAGSMRPAASAATASGMRDGA